MALEKKHIKYLVEQTLKEIGLYSEHAVNLILGTIAVESLNGTFLVQLKAHSSVGALGISQMERITHDDLLQRVLKRKFLLKYKIKRSCNINKFEAENLVFNLKYAIAMCRVKYLSIPEKLPTTIEGYAMYWKKYYNTYKGKGTVEDFIKRYKHYVL